MATGELFIFSLLKSNVLLQDLLLRSQSTKNAMPGFPPSELNEGCTLPADARVIGLVFYGRKEFVSILDLYLKVWSESAAR